MIILLAVAAALASLSMSEAANSHRYEDDYIERAFAVVVKDRTAICEYSVGLNTKTANKLLKQIQQRQLQAKSKESPQKKGKPSKDPTPEKEPETTAPTNEIESATDSSNSQEGSPASGEHLTDPDTIRQFSKLSAFWLEHGMVVTCNGKPTKLTKIKLTPEARHPFSMTIQFEFQIEVAPSSDSPRTGNLKIQDRMFPQFDGAVRYAIKTRGNSMLARSNVAPILVRADRVELKQVAKQAGERGMKVEQAIDNLTKIEAQLVFSESKSQNRMPNDRK